MKIVIELDDNVYGLLKRTERVFKYIDKEDDTVDTALMRAVINGTPLPKVHGRLIDADWVKNTLDLYTLNFEGIYKQFIRRSDIDTVPTIIEGSDSE